MLKFLRSQKSIFFFFLLFGGLISVLFKFELLWDFANYHYYNPWAFINDRINDDVAVAGLNAFFNPLIDLPLYYLIEYFNTFPDLIYFYQGLWFGFLGYVFFKIAGYFFDTETENGIIALALTVLAGLTGYAVFSQIGTSTNEIMLSSLMMLSLWLLIREIFVNRRNRKAIFFIAGFIAGSAMGLKLTMVIYCVAMGISLFVFYRNIEKPLPKISLFIFGGLTGFLLFDGYWLWKMWEIFHNPFFPFANAIFRSEFIEEINYIDGRFIPDSWLRFLFLPFYWVFNIHRDEGNVTVIDYRLALAYLALLVWGLRDIIRRRKKEVVCLDYMALFLLVFGLISYVIWIRFFAIVRYLIPIELLSSLLIVKTMFVFVPENRKWRGLYIQLSCVVFFSMLLTPLFSQVWGCRDCEVDGRQFDQFVEVKNVKIPDDSLLMFYNYPTSALLPYFSRETQNLRAINVKQKNYLSAGMDYDYFNRNEHWIKLKKDVFDKHKGPKIALIAVGKSENISIFQKEEPLLAGMICKKLENNILPYYEICVPKEFEDKIFVK